jgi:hypothetical protein
MEMWVERMLRRWGAVFIVSPDGSRHPNENVMIDLGLVAGRMGRARVALGVCGDVALPSDLLPVTRIDMNGTLPIENAAIERLSAWAKPIPEILNSVSCADVLHGYSGRWRVILNFDKWRTESVTGKSIAALSADLLLQIPTCGHGGTGLLVGANPSLGRGGLHRILQYPQSLLSGYKLNRFNWLAKLSEISSESDG